MHQFGFSNRITRHPGHRLQRNSSHVDLYFYRQTEKEITGWERQREWQERYTEDKRDVEEDPAVHSWRQIDSQEESAMKAFVGFSVLHSKLHTDWYRSCTCKPSQELDLWRKSVDMTSHIEKRCTYTMSFYDLCYGLSCEPRPKAPWILFHTQKQTRMQTRVYDHTCSQPLKGLQACMSS